jgi:uncharacterized membrane protein YjgN (DUF898 family)
MTTESSFSMNIPPVETASTATIAPPEPLIPHKPVRYVLSFSGTGSEYFKIWIVNLFLMMVTLGIYYPWAKVRKAQYLHRNMVLDGAAFDYHASGGTILKGTLIAGVLYGAYHLIESSGSGWGFLLFVLALCAVLPWLLWKSLRFKLSVTSYRALPFSFTAGLKDSYVVFIPIVLYNAAILAVFFMLKPGSAGASKAAQMTELKNLAITLGALGLLILLLTPLFHFLLKRYQHNHYQWTSLRSTINLTLRQTYVQWTLLGLPFIAFYGVVGILAFVFATKLTGIGLALLIPLMIALYVFTLLVPVLFKAMFTARFQNLIWNNTRAQGIHFVSALKARTLAWLYVKNLFLIAITFGLYWPFALISVIKLRAASISIVAAAPLMHLAAQHARADKERNAVGDAVGELFDIDIAL